MVSYEYIRKLLHLDDTRYLKHLLISLDIVRGTCSNYWKELLKRGLNHSFLVFVHIVCNQAFSLIESSNVIYPNFLFQTIDYAHGVNFWCTKSRDWVCTLVNILLEIVNFFYLLHTEH